MSSQHVRKAKPNMVLQIWKSLNYIKLQKQIADIKRITSYLHRTFGMSERDAQANVDLSVSDGLIVEYSTVGNKGSKVGVEQIGYKLPEDDFKYGKHDWYCFVCHSPGDVLECINCCRVVHPSCLTHLVSGTRFTCEFCLQASQPVKRWTKSELKTFLCFIVSRLKDKAKELYHLDETKYGCDCARLVHSHMDLSAIERKVEYEQFSGLADIIGDVHTILHNVCVCLGDNCGLAELAILCLNDCKSEVKEIENCSNCYLLYNTKPKNWFIEVCDPPHDLVYAKMKGYPYWPSKVIKRDGDNYEVRFFGGFHQRGTVPSSNVKMITVDIKELDVKPQTASFNKAYNELHMHQEKLAGRLQRGLQHCAKRPNSCDENSDSSSDLVSSTQDSAPQHSSGMPKSPPDSSQVASSDSSTTSSRPVKKAKLSKSTATVTSQSNNTAAGNSQTLRDSAGQDSSERQLSMEKALKQLEDKLQKKFEKEKEEAVTRAIQEADAKKAAEVQKAKDEVSTEYEKQIEDLNAKHKEEISTVKKKQWCYSCEAAAIYHCCWNTAYCSVDCQQLHWHKEHKRVCRRKR